MEHSMEHLVEEEAHLLIPDFQDILEGEEELPVLLKNFQEQLVEEKKEVLLDILDQENMDMEGMTSLLKRVEDILVIPNIQKQETDALLRILYTCHTETGFD